VKPLEVRNRLNLPTAKVTFANTTASFDTIAAGANSIAITTVGNCGRTVW